MLLQEIFPDVVVHAIVVWLPQVGAEIQECIYLIEGYMKADIVHFFTGQTVLAIPGVTSLHYLEKALKELTELGVRHVCLSATAIL